MSKWFVLFCAECAEFFNQTMTTTKVVVMLPFFFSNCIVQLGFSPWKIRCFCLGKPAATESYYPTYGACWVFQCFHNPPKSGMDNRIFKVRTDVNACDCIREYADTVRESALKVDSGRKISCRTEESKLRQRHAGLTLSIELHSHPGYYYLCHYWLQQSDNAYSPHSL